MTKIRRLLYPLLLSLMSLIVLIMISGLQVKATDSKVSVSIQDAVSKADTNAYVVDQTLRSKISNNTDLMDSQSQSYLDTDSVHPGDDLEFNYMLAFDSGDDINNTKVTISLPDDVTFNTGTVGKIIYTSSDGTKTMTTDIPSTDVDTDDKSLTTSINDIGSDKNYTSVRIVLSAKAGDAGKTVAASHIDYESDNYDDYADTPKFDIKEPANSIVAATDNSSLQTYDGNEFNLTGTMDYQNDAGVPFKNENMYIYTTIDGVSQLPVQDTLSSDKNFSLIMKPLAIGSHTITVQVVQNNYKDTGETIVSNVLTYDVNVSENSLIITKDKSFDGDGYTVNDDKPVDIKGTYKHADGEPAHNESEGLSITYQITSKADTDSPNVQDEQKVKSADDDGTFDFQVKPFAHEMGTSGALANQSLTYDDYVAKYGYKGLEVGKNIVTVNLEDDHGHKSDPTQFVINVPDIKLNLALNSTDIQTINGSDSIGHNYSLGATITSSDSSYRLSADLMFGHNQLNNVLKRVNQTVPSGAAGQIYIDFDVYMGKLINYDFTSDNPAKSDTPYPASFYICDAYGRKSNTVDYNVTFRSKYVEIKTENNYKFKNFKNSDKEAPKRDGDWSVKVESYKSSWTLRASATPFYQYFSDGRKPVELGGHLFYSTPRNDDGMITSLPMENQLVVIDKYTGNINNNNIVTTDIASEWEDDTGITLGLRGPSNSYTGTYTSTIDWEATDSI